MYKFLVFASLLHLTSISLAKNIDTRELFKEGNITTTFDASMDSLCFDNKDFDSSMGYNPFGKVLGLIANTEGACQGMVGVSAAVKMNVEFRPDEEKLSTRKVNKILKKAVKLYHQNCSRKVVLPGFSSLKTLCEEHLGTLKKRSVYYNLELARKEILPRWNTFFIKRTLKDPVKKTDHLLAELKSIYKNLKEGRYPLMLIRSHVTLVTKFRVIRDSEGFITDVIIRHYDPNMIMSTNRDLYKRVYKFNRDGSIVNGRLIWDITPTPIFRNYCSN